MRAVGEETPMDGKAKQIMGEVIASILIKFVIFVTTFNEQFIIISMSCHWLVVIM